MVKVLSLLAGLILQSTIVFGLATASFETKENYALQIVVNGKVINDIPKKRVKIKGGKGSHDLLIKVYDEAGCLTYEHQDIVFFTPGFQSDFSFYLLPENCIEFEQIRVTRIYSEKIRRPDIFYNKQLIADRQKYMNSYFS
ncbi:hypothetical protein E1176_02505 [Fulvivirga sp. RKSG066]|uniref:hypothetical protein n=1 Tax=Fulvivirga aurantia TaxID=2529383 RepID=UPI0012BC93CF|nr:hypothetical protein [Fulvivirga aurantia]MTI19883.1 hypothetical protein [Fulvivirga aurantia]